MTALETKKNQINCYYCSGRYFSQQLEAFLESTEKDILLIDIAKTMPSDTLWHDMASQLDKSLGGFIDVNQLDNFDKNGNYSEESWVKILAKNPKSLIGAILIEGDRIAHVENYMEALTFFDVDSAGLEKTMHTKAPTTTTQTEDDSFI